MAKTMDFMARRAPVELDLRTAHGAQLRLPAKSLEMLISVFYLNEINNLKLYGAAKRTRTSTGCPTSTSS